MFFPNLSKPLPVWQQAEPEAERFEKLETLSELNKADFGRWIRQEMNVIKATAIREGERIPGFWCEHLTVKIRPQGKKFEGGWEEWPDSYLLEPDWRFSCLPTIEGTLRYRLERLIEGELGQALLEPCARRMLEGFLPVSPELRAMVLRHLPRLFKEVQRGFSGVTALNRVGSELMSGISRILKSCLAQALNELTLERLQLDVINEAELGPERLAFMVDLHRAGVNFCFLRDFYRFDHPELSTSRGANSPMREVYDVYLGLLTLNPLAPLELYPALWSMVAERRRECDLARDRALAVEAGAARLLRGEDAAGLTSCSVEVASYLPIG